MDCSTLLPPSGVLNVHLPELLMKAADRPRRPLGQAIPAHPQEPSDEPAGPSRAGQRLRDAGDSSQQRGSLQPVGTPRPAPRLSPPTPGVWRLARPVRSSSLGGSRPRAFRPEPSSMLGSCTPYGARAQRGLGGPGGRDGGRRGGRVGFGTGGAGAVSRRVQPSRFCRCRRSLIGLPAP